MAIHTDTPPDPYARSPSTALSSSPRDSPQGRRKALALAPINDPRAAYPVVLLTKLHWCLGVMVTEGRRRAGGGVALDADGVHARDGGLELRQEVVELVAGVVAELN